MNINEKLKILSGAAKYDVSCSSSGSNRQNTKKGVGNSSVSGICHSYTPDGRCVSLLKILLSNYCIYAVSYTHLFLTFSYSAKIEFCSCSLVAVFIG